MRERENKCGSLLDIMIPDSEIILVNIEQTFPALSTSCQLIVQIPSEIRTKWVIKHLFSKTVMGVFGYDILNIIVDTVAAIP